MNKMSGEVKIEDHEPPQIEIDAKDAMRNKVFQNTCFTIKSALPEKIKPPLNGHQKRKIAK